MRGRHKNYLILPSYCDVRRARWIWSGGTVEETNNFQNVGIFIKFVCIYKIRRFLKSMVEKYIFFSRKCRIRFFTVSNGKYNSDVSLFTLGFNSIYVAAYGKC